MDSTVLVLLVVAALVLVAALAWYFLVYVRRRTHLREQFGPEYERAVVDIGDRKRAEQELERREDRVRSLDIRPLAPQESTRFADLWRHVQARFVDSPSDAIRDADQLVLEVMEARGYPVGDFDQRAADVSVDHPRVVENYRAARVISLRNGRGEASTEDLRQAMVHYRALFEDLLDAGARDRMEVKIERA